MLSSTVESLPEPVAQPSSRRPRTQIGRLAMRSMMCWLSSYETKFHSTSSLTYTSCSSLKTCSMKRLCSDSLVKLMHSWGNELVLKFSNPKMSSSPTQCAAL